MHRPNAVISLTSTQDLLGSHKKQHDLVLMTSGAGAERTFREIWTGKLAEKKMLIRVWKLERTLAGVSESFEERPIASSQKTCPMFRVARLDKRQFLLIIVKTLIDATFSIAM